MLTVFSFTDIGIRDQKVYSESVQEMSEITIREEIHENDLDDERVPYERLKDGSMERSQLTITPIATRVNFFLCQLNFDSRDL